MSLSTNVSTLATRVGQEIKAVRLAAQAAGLLWSTTVDFGTTEQPVAAFTLSVPGVQAGADVMAAVSFTAPAGAQADEQLLEPVAVLGARVLAAGSVEIVCATLSGAPLVGKRVVVMATGTTTGMVGQTVNAQTGTAYTVVSADVGCWVTLSNAAAITVTLPTPTSLGLPVGAMVDFTVLGAGMATFTAGAGATVNATPSAVTRAQWSSATAKALSTTAWLIVGDLA